MKKIIIALILIILAGAVFVVARNYLRKNNTPVPAKNISTTVPAGDNQNSSQVAAPAPVSSDNKNVTPAQNSSEFLSPLDLGRASDKKAVWHIHNPQNFARPAGKISGLSHRDGF